MIAGWRGIMIVAALIIVAFVMAAEWWTSIATLPFLVALHLLKTLLGWVEFAWRL
jgi:hypothetical protein